MWILLKKKCEGSSQRDGDVSLWRGGDVVVHGQRDRDGCSATMSKIGPEVCSEGCSEMG